MKAPTHLKHKPIIVVNDYQTNYENIGGSDAEALSIGLAQWVNSNNDISAKVFRYVGQWSRQSEELPPHRVIDLCILLLSSFINDSNNHPLTILNEKVINQADLIKIEKYFKANRGCLVPKIQELNKIINLFAAANNIVL